MTQFGIAPFEHSDQNRSRKLLASEDRPSEIGQLLAVHLEELPPAQQETVTLVFYRGLSSRRCHIPRALRWE